MKINIRGGVQKLDGRYLHTVFVNDERFENVENIKRCTYDKCVNCKYYSNCWNNNGVVRFFDCKKNFALIGTLYSLLTSILVVCYFYQIFFIHKMPLFKGISFMIFGFVALDIVCSILEDIVTHIRDKHFYKKLKKDNIKMIEENEKREKEKIEHDRAEDERKLAESPYYADVLKSEKFVKSMQDLCKECSFGSGSEVINECIAKLMEVISIVKREGAGYNRVEFLFGGLLEEFYNTMKLYASYSKANIVEENDDRVLLDCANKFLKYLQEKKVEEIISESSSQSKFRTSAKAFSDMIDGKDDE